MTDQEEFKDVISDYVSFLQGSDTYPQFDGSFVLSAAKSIKYTMKKKYYRENTLYAVLDLLTRKFEDINTQELARSLAWQLIQDFPLSVLMEIPGILQSKKIRVPTRLRNALVFKFATSSLNAMRRAFFFAPARYREMFEYLFLPTEKFKNKAINNVNYMYAVKLYKESTTDSIVKEVGVENLVTQMRIPLHLVMQYVEDQEDAEILSRLVNDEDFFRHAQWFRQIIGDTAFFPLAESRAKRVKDPMSFLRIKEHLAEKGIMNNKLEDLMTERTKEIMDKMIKDANITGLGIFVDVSGSMLAAKVLATKLYRAFSFMGSNVTDLIVFATGAANASLDQLEKSSTGGSTSIGSAFLLFHHNVTARQNSNIPNAILLVTDMGENTSPTLPEVMPLIKKNYNMPVIVLFVHSGMYRFNDQRLDNTIKDRFGDYPVAVMKVTDFHDRLTNEIIKEIVGLSGKVAVAEKEVTEVVKFRKPLHEEIGVIGVKNRPSYTLSPNFFKMLLTSGKQELDVPLKTVKKTA